MKKRILKACTAGLALLAASAAMAATPDVGPCGARDAGNAAGESPCIRVAIHTEGEGLRPAAMRATLAVPSKEDMRPPARDNRLPEPGGWATLLAGLLGALAIARRRVS